MGNYLIVVQAPCHRIDSAAFATEGAFGEHLRMLRARTADRFDRLVVAAPEFSTESYEAQRQSLAHIDEHDERIEFVATHELEGGRLRFWRGARGTLSALSDAVSKADLVHSGLSDDLWRPMLLMANTLAKLRGKPLIFVVDIDFRNDTQMYFETGVWSRRAYWVNRLLYDPLKRVQVELAPRWADLVLLKSPRMVREIGRGAPHVRAFFDTVHAEEQVIDDDEVTARVRRLTEDRPLRGVFFGRFVEYKGLDRTLQAVASARRQGSSITLDLIGQGPEEARLRELTSELELGAAVRFLGALPYGEPLFTAIAEADFAIATPLVEDTPRAAFDAFARGLPIVAFGIRYYRDLEEASGAVACGTWPDPDALATVISELDRDRERLGTMTAAAARFARENTQEIWLDRRLEWTRQILHRRGGEMSPPPPTE